VRAAVLTRSEDMQHLAETKLTVQRQFTRSGRDVGLAKDVSESLEVRQFATEPAQVAVKMGMTVQLGNYESVRVDVSLTVPCYFEEHEVAYEYARGFVEKRVIDEANEAKRYAQGRASSF
jgi:hypothetical protein